MNPTKYWTADHVKKVKSVFNKIRAKDLKIIHVVLVYLVRGLRGYSGITCVRKFEFFGKTDPINCHVRWH